MTVLNPAQTESLRTTIARARAGQASLGEMGTACDLAASAGLPGCAGELRSHIARAAGAERARSVKRDVVLGVATGALTHLLMREV